MGREEPGLGVVGLVDRLAEARAGALVGRERERGVLDRMLSGARDAPLVAYLHGPGGIGKSSLVRYAARQAELAGRRVVRVDGRFLDADPRRLEEAAAAACVEPGVVLLIDTFEQCQPLEAWLRESFLLRLADRVIVVVAGRTAPDAEWSLDPGWAQLFTALPMRSLDPAESDALLAARGVPAEQRGAFVAFAGGSPLALSLAASVPPAAPGAPWEPTGDTLTSLVERLVGDLPSAVHRRALEVVAQAYVTREPLLRAVLGDEDTHMVFSWLRQLPYIEVTPEGLYPHDAVRATLEADLRWRDPERYDDVRARVSLAGLQAVRSATADDALLTAPVRGPGDQLPRAAFEEGVLEALRTWHTPREFATSVLVRSHLVAPGSPDPVAELRGAITTALDAIQTDPAGVKAHEALTTTYITAPRTHKAAARRLGVPYGTYRRHLALAKERLIEQLLRQPATTPVTPVAGGVTRGQR
ncbi:AAA family ATPase [Streptomyces sp. NPDC048523]|uniref:AAA family ATPase n=1 Tax=Streptomyces sp. NPDC048523 TaxID=3365567 RepID=UPI00370F7E22